MSSLTLAPNKLSAEWFIKALKSGNHATSACQSWYSYLFMHGRGGRGSVSNSQGKSETETLRDDKWRGKSARTWRRTRQDDDYRPSGVEKLVAPTSCVVVNRPTALNYLFYSAQHANGVIHRRRLFHSVTNLIKKCTNIVVNAFHGRSINFPWRFLNTKACSCYCYSYRFGWAQREVMHNSSSHKTHNMHGQPVMRGIDWIMVNRDHFNIDIWGWT